MQGLFKRILVLGACALTLLSFAAAPLTALAASTTPDGEEGRVGFRVSAVIPDNQIDTSLSYFDLQMHALDEQTLEVEVFNEENAEITVEVSAISASTNRNGVIDYRTPGIRDKTLLHPFSEIAAVRSPALSIPAGGSASVLVDVVMPQDEFDGVILGGIVITRRDDNALTDETPEGSGGVIFNSYSYIVGVKLTETDTVVEPAFELFSVEAQTVNYRPAVVYYLRNSEAAIVKGMNVKATVTEAQSSNVVLEDSWVIDMAPNSVIELPSYTSMDTLRPGDYNGTLTLTFPDSGRQAVVLEFAFTILGQQVEEIESTVPQESAATGTPMWVWILAGMMALVIILLFILIIILLKRRKKEQNETNGPSAEQAAPPSQHKND